MYLMNGTNDKVLKRINKTISKEREVEFTTQSTLWMQRCIAAICLLLSALSLIQISTYAYREAKLIYEYDTKIDSLQNEISSLTKSLESAENLVAEQSERIKILENDIDNRDNALAEIEATTINLQGQMRTLESENSDLTETLSSLTNAYSDLNEAYIEFAERDELYDKYEYALFEDGKERTDLTYDMCAYAEQLMLDYNLDPDLLFSIGMTESRYTEKCKNPDSTATGFHQFLQGTGEWVYEELGYTEPYNHATVQTDGYKSLECGAWYLNYLYNRNDGNILRVIEGYRGLKNPTGYINKINSYLATKDKSLDDMDESLTLFSIEAN